MDVSLDAMRRLAHGATDVSESDGVFQFHRLTEAQRAVFAGQPELYRKTFATSGIRLEFVTDAAEIAVSGCAEPASSRDFYDFDVAVNGVLVQHHSYDSTLANPEFSFEIKLDGKPNRVALYLPCLARVGVKRLVFPDGSTVRPVEKKRRLLCYGDSITQGYDTRHPALSYPNQLADVFDAEMMNKGVGADTFNPRLADLPDAETPDLITVAYGTNDWAHPERGDLSGAAKEFFSILARRYPETPVCTILPVWRRDFDRVTGVGTFADAANIIREAAGDHPRNRVIDGWKLLPHLSECVTDGLHPNDFGFSLMTRNLLKEFPAF